MQPPPDDGDGPGVGECKLGPPPPDDDGPRAPPRRLEFPELVGVDGEEARARIKEAHPELRTVVVVPPNSAVTLDFRLDRVRVFVDGEGKVSRPPRTG